MVARDGQPASHRIAHELRAAIVSGELAPGAELPSEHDLSTTHGVARDTARAAVSLIDEGLVTRRHGSAAYVREKRRLMRFGAGRYSHRTHAETGVSPFRAEVAEQGLTARTECRSITRTVPPADVAQRLDVDPDAESVARTGTSPTTSPCSSA